MKFFQLSKIISVIFVFFATAAAEGAVTLHYPGEHDIGQPFIAFISSDAPFDRASIQWLGKSTPLEVVKYDDGYRAYALLGAAANRIEQGGKYPITFRASDGARYKSESFHIKLNTRKYPVTRLSVPPKMVNPPKSELKRIEEEAALTAQARAMMTPSRAWQLKAAQPLSGKIHQTNGYGVRRVYNGVTKGLHSGVDLRAPTGTPVASIFSGEVILTGDHYFAGKSVYIDSGNGVISAYFHLSSISASQGDIVNAGDIIGMAGATGRVTGPHLHLSVFLSGQSIDPMGLIDINFPNIVNLLQKGEM